MVELLTDRTDGYGKRLAIVDGNGMHPYAELMDESARVASALIKGSNDLCGERIAFRIAPGFSWVATLFGIWRGGGVAVPLPIDAPASELEYFVHHSRASTVIFDEASASAIQPLASSLPIDASLYSHLAGAEPAHLPRIDGDRFAMILYTSGTTSRPKGVVSTHANISAQVAALVEAWEWSADDRILLCLPLHHVHGIVNIVCCAAWSGAVCEMLPRFDANTVWERIASGSLTLFMAVPTIYARLILAWEASTPVRRNRLSEAASRLRLMVSGSAALPVSTLERWKEITGQTLLERYGMTEIGMALSNPYRGDRIPGTVGRPLPRVEVRLVDEGGEQAPDGTVGEIEIRGPNVFAEYWENEEATRAAFRDGWFRTGDTAVMNEGVYKILGRTSVDIIKTGGHKVSALEVEAVLLRHPAIAECAVIGAPDNEWGERVAAAVVLHPGKLVELETLRDWCKQQISAHKAPSRLVTVDALPRNAMGKVTKSAVKEMFR